MKLWPLAIAFLLYSCGTNSAVLNRSTSVASQVDYNLLLINELDRLLYYDVGTEQNIGYLNAAGEETIAPQFQNGTDFFGEYANVVKDSVFGYVDKQGRVKLFPEYDEVYWYYGPIGYAKKNGKYGMLTRAGALLTDLEYDRFGFSVEGYFNVRKGDRWMIIDEQGNELLGDSIDIGLMPVYQNRVVFTEGSGNSLKKGLVDIQGNVIVAAQYDNVSGYFSDGLMHVQNDNLHGFVDQTGKVVIPLEYEKLNYEFSEGLVPAKKDGKWGYLNRDNEVVIDFIYQSARPFSEGLAMVQQNGRCGYINRASEVVIPITLPPVPVPGFREERAVYKSENGKFGYLDPQGEPVIEAKFDTAQPFEGGRAHVRVGDREGYINRDGQIVIDIAYTYIWSVSSGMMRYSR